MGVYVNKVYMPGAMSQKANLISERVSLTELASFPAVGIAETLEGFCAFMEGWIHLAGWMVPNGRWVDGTN